ncbi:MAG: CHAD domain-containing protein [Aestuariivirga sp.]
MKFAVTGEQLERAKSLSSMDGLGVAKPVTQILRSTYFDTPRCNLHDNGFSLRLRRIGRAWYQTVKAETGVSGGVSNPFELETRVPGRAIKLDFIAHPPLRDRLKEVIGNDPLRPVFETVVERTTQKLTTLEGGKLELVLDKGVVKTPEDSQAICEAEIELKSGRPEALLAVVDQLFVGEVPLPSQSSKSEIGYGLLGGKGTPQLEPLKASIPAMPRGCDCAAVLATILRALARQILHNWDVVRLSEDPEGAHQMRVGLRRLRTALNVFKPVIREGSFLDMERDVRDLAHLIGELRDADVLAADIVKPLQDHREWAVPVEPLLELLDKRRSEVRLDVRHKLATSELHRLQLRFALLPIVAEAPSSQEMTGKASRPARAFSRKAIEKCWRKVAKRGRHIAELGEEDRHALRKDLKALRYAIEFFSAFYPEKRVQRFTAKLEVLQNLFGYLNDVMGARRLTQVPTGASPSDAEARQAISYVIGWHTAHAEDTWREARAKWKKLEATPRFWN